MEIDIYILGEYKGNAIFNESEIYTTFIIDEDQLALDSKKQRITIDHLRDTHCPFCYHKRIHIKDKLWLCPGMDSNAQRQILLVTKTRQPAKDSSASGLEMTKTSGRTRRES